MNRETERRVTFLLLDLLVALPFIWWAWHLL